MTKCSSICFSNRWTLSTNVDVFVFFLQYNTNLEYKHHDFTIFLLHLFYKFVTTKKTPGNYGINLNGKRKV